MQAVFFVAFSALAGAMDFGPNLLADGGVVSTSRIFFPWDGVDDQGRIHGIDGYQLAVRDAGQIYTARFSPSVAVADLNADGKPDLVLGDSKGFFWYFANTGTAQQPFFAHGEVMPVWLGNPRLTVEDEGFDSVVPRIQLVNFDGRLFDLIAGTYAGRLFHVPNSGAPTRPNFQTSNSIVEYDINTHLHGQLWCNYLAPFLTTSFNSKAQEAMPKWDLVMGEGTYAANSIYFLQNTSGGGKPSFDENHLNKIIPGMGLEQLVPAVVDWNNDGKPDIITGDRTGHLTLYLNTSSDPTHPTFDEGRRISVGGQSQFGGFTTVTVCDLTGNHLPNLLIGTDAGTLLYALNTGALGSPSFNTPITPLKGKPSTTYVAPNGWSKYGCWGAPYEMLSAVNPQTESGFTFPEGVRVPNALKFWVAPLNNLIFTHTHYTDHEDELNEHVIQADRRFQVRKDGHYRIHFWAKSDRGDINFKIKLFHAAADYSQAADLRESFAVDSTWTECSRNVDFHWAGDDSTVLFGFEFRYTNQPTLYICDVSMQEKK